MSPHCFACALAQALGCHGSEDLRDVQAHFGLCRLRCKSWLSNCVLFKSSLSSACLQYLFLTFTCTPQAK